MMKRPYASKQNKPSSSKSIPQATKLPSITQNKKIHSVSQQNKPMQLNTSKHQDDGLIMLIHQYFIKNNFFQSLEVFQKDCLKGYKPNQTKSLQTIKKQLLQSFDLGQRQVFFNRFNQLVALSLRCKDPQTMKLEFYMQLYFFIYSTHPMLGKKRTPDTAAKQHFVAYLQGRGAVLGKQQQFLQFYALGSYPKPQQHPSFKQMFTKQWIQELRKKVVFYVDKLYPSGKTPSLVNIYDRFIEHGLQQQEKRNSRYSSSLTEPRDQAANQGQQQVYEFDQEIDADGDDNQDNFQNNRQKHANDISRIEQQIQEHIGQHDQSSLSIINNPSPVLLQNSNVANRDRQRIINNRQYDSAVAAQSQALQPQSQQLPQPTEKQLMLAQRVAQLQEQKISLLSFIQNSKYKYQNLQNDFKEFSGSIQNTLMESQLKWFKITQQLYNVASDLLKAAITLQKGEVLADPQVISKRQQKLSRYSSFVNMKVDDLFSDSVGEYSLFQRAGDGDNSVDMMMGRRAQPSNQLLYERDQKLMQIDFPLVKKTLAIEQIKEERKEVGGEEGQEGAEGQWLSQEELDMEKCLLLQALRWRITRLRGAFQKRQVILSYTSNDILALREGQGEGEEQKDAQQSQDKRSLSNQSNKQKKSPSSSSLSRPLLNTLLGSPNPNVVYYTALLISALSKDYYGREYLFDEGLITLLVNLRRQDNTDERVKGIVLVIFQLQSNKRACQAVMIDHGLIEQIVFKLDRQRDLMTSFIMEYETALLLNLVLSKKGLDRAQLICPQILMALINLMETESTRVKSFVHASLYPLLSRKIFRQKALEFGMEDNLKYLLQNSSPEFQHQLKYVYDRLLMDNDIDQDKDEEPQFDEINDEQIGQDYEHDVEQINASLSGEFFLMKKYPLTGPQAVQQMKLIKEEARATFQRSIYNWKQLTERMSIQTPLLGNRRKSNVTPPGGLTHNNSVYSNRSSNRGMLRSEKNSRIKNSTSQNNQRSNMSGGGGTGNGMGIGMGTGLGLSSKEKLDTVQQNGSEASLKDYNSNSNRHNNSNSHHKDMDIGFFNNPSQQNTHAQALRMEPGSNGLISSINSSTNPRQPQINSHSNLNLFDNFAQEQSFDGVGLTPKGSNTGSQQKQRQSSKQRARNSLPQPKDTLRGDLQVQNGEGTFRQHNQQQQRAMLPSAFTENELAQNNRNGSNHNNRQIINSNNQSSQPLQQVKKLKPYQQTDEYRQAFGTRQTLCRTPPQKES